MHQVARRVLLHLNLIPGIGAQTIKKILDTYPVEYLPDMYRLSALDIEHRIRIPSAYAQKIVAGLSDMRVLEQEEALLAQHGIRFTTIIDTDYPELLRHIHAPPPVLYVQGATLPDGNRSVACVGSRDADGYGSTIVRMLVPELVHTGWATISGGARGIDGMVHQATLDAQGVTVAVIGSGLLRVYPDEHRPLFARIAQERGVLASPFPLRMAPLAHNFPARNRIIAGLCRGTLVIQAALKSGALITAQYALQEGRDVAAVPGLITNPISAGCHALIAQGATLIHNSHDMQLFLGEPPTPRAQDKRSALVEKDPLLALCSRPCSVDELMVHTGLAFDTISARLWELQAQGQVDQTNIGLWQTV